MKTLFFLYFLSFSTLAEDKNYLFNDKINSEILNPDKFLSLIQEAPFYLTLKSRNEILSDINNKVSSDFKIEKYHESNVRFWFYTYTQFDQEQVLIHDKKNLDLIYERLDFKEINKLAKNPFQRVKRQNQLAAIRLESIKESLLALSKNPSLNNKDSSKLKNFLIKKFGKLPDSKDLINLSEQLRTQTGQRDHFERALKEFDVYKPALIKLADKFLLPSSILALSLLESRFNPEATSLVEAKGVWQIMPYIGEIIFPSEKNIFYERSIPIASLGAFEILRQNFRSFKRWDLTLTAYNAGIRRVKDALKKSKSNKGLESLVSAGDDSLIGFAALNFYAEFLALVYMVQYEKKIFKEISPRLTPIKKFYFYLSNCSLIPDDFYKKFDEPQKIRALNTHFRMADETYPKGVIVASHKKLTAKRFTQIPNVTLKYTRAKSFEKKIKIGKCL